MYKIFILLLLFINNIYTFTYNHNLFYPKLNFKNNKFKNFKMLSNFDTFNWKKNWYPIALEDRTDKTKPFEFTLLGNSLVIWWDKLNNEWCSTDNQCSHRLAPLSEGRINDKGVLECPYHGWCFNSTGNCIKIPQRENLYSENNKRFNINSYNIVTKQGIIWIWPEKYTNSYKPSIDLIPTSPPIDKGFITDDFSLDLPYDYSLLLENILDISHVPFTHHGSQGNRNLVSSKNIKYNITNNISNNGFKIDIIKGFANHTEFKAPCYQHTNLQLKTINPLNIFKSHNKNRDESKKILIDAWVVAYAIPKSPGYSRIIARFPIHTSNNIFTKFLLFSKPAFIRHMGRNEVLEEDTIFLHQQEKELLLRDKNFYNYNTTLKHYKLATETDTPVLLWRKWLKYVGPIPWGKHTNIKYFNKKEELINRKEFHLKHCKICQNAYNNLEIIKKKIVYIKPIILIIIWPLLNNLRPDNIIINRLTSISLLILTSIIWFYCNELQNKMKFGKYPPKRNIIE
jgi:phenylpropionate dioxygenase-like ring-hydroxylating dioxygenase large terminal subunit